MDGTRLGAEQHDRAPEACRAGRGRERGTEVGPWPTTPHHVVAAPVERIGDEHLQGPHLVAAECEARQVVALDPDLAPERLAQPRGGDERSREEREREPWRLPHRRRVLEAVDDPADGSDVARSEEVGGRGFGVASGHQPGRIERVGERPPVAAGGAEDLLERRLGTVLAERGRQHAEDPLRRLQALTGVDVRPHPGCVDLQAVDAAARPAAARSP